MHKQPNVSLRNEVEHAIQKGLGWLETNQNSNGHWSTPEHPAITALALMALKGSPGLAMAEKETPESVSVRKGYEFLLRHVQPDGGIYKKDLPNYNTALALTALAVRNLPDDRAAIRNARRFLMSSQSDFDETGRIDNPFDGGIGYGSKYKHSDLSNTALALEALYYSRRLVDDPKLADARELNWPAVIHFIQSCQNLPTYNSEKWASDDAQNKGGFVYYPGHSMAGETNLPSGRSALRSYGSISYAGLMSYLYADLRRDDPRVIAVFDWLRGNFTLEENPGMGAQGLFYYFHTMAKALTLYGVDTLETKGGQKIQWRDQLALKLINLQQTDGSWANPNNRWWEKDAALVTAYAVIALELIHRKL